MLLVLLPSVEIEGELGFLTLLFLRMTSLFIEICGSGWKNLLLRLIPHSRNRFDQGSIFMALIWTAWARVAFPSLELV